MLRLAQEYTAAPTTGRHGWSMQLGAGSRHVGIGEAKISRPSPENTVHQIYRF
jgi:hypothetical protein